MWVSHYSEKKVNAEREVEGGWPTQRKRTESREPDRVRRSVVSGAVPVWVSPSTLMPEGTVLLHKAQWVETTKCQDSCEPSTRIPGPYPRP
jgi:hypothetical protein